MGYINLQNYSNTKSFTPFAPPNQWPGYYVQWNSCPEYPNCNTIPYSSNINCGCVNNTSCAVGCNENCSNPPKK